MMRRRGGEHSLLNYQYSDPLGQQWLLLLKVSCQLVIAQINERLPPLEGSRLPMKSSLVITYL